MEEVRLMLKNIGKINPVSAKEYAETGGYKALEKAIENPAEIIPRLNASGLRGRGGAGFPVGRKWEIVKAARSDRKYIVCNADEGEPGTNKDRVLLCGDPHSVLEGMIIAGIAVGAEKGILYIRAEYPYVHNILRKAVTDAGENGYLGNAILGSRYNFDIEVRTGQGAYLCGEETALLESIEGKRGETRLKPPFPGVSGLWGKPTVINNVESMACIPIVMMMGEQYKKYGTPKNPGTKLFTLSGNISRPGVYEFPMGISIRELFEAAGGGCPNNKKLLAVQTGGASGSMISPELLDTPLDIESCAAVGASMGTGDLMFIDEEVCMVDLCRNIISFYAEECCGKCVPCRYGTRQLADLLTDICDGKGTLENLEELEQLAAHIRQNALCGLGAAAPTPILSTLKIFRSEFEAHINQRTCRAGVCPDLSHVREKVGV